MGIRGSRFKCAVCPNFDLCAHCEALGKHPANHPMILLYGAVNELMAVRPFLWLRELMGRGGNGHGQGGHHGGRWGGRWGRGRHQNRHQNPGQNQNSQNGGGFGNWWGPPSFGGGHGCPPPFMGCHAQNAQGQNGQGQSQAPRWKRWRSSEEVSQSENVSAKMERAEKAMADFVCDVTLPDRTYYPTDTVLTKTWRMRNSGESAWGDGVSLVFFKGCESLTLEKRYPVKNARAGEEIEVSAVLKTPTKKGRYCSYYRLQRNGEFFGPRVWVDIFAVDEPNEPNEKKKEKKKKEKVVEVTESEEVGMVLVDEEQLLDDIAAMAVQEMSDDNVAPPMVSNITNEKEKKEVFVYQVQLDTLKGMGFSNEEQIKAELVQQKGNVQRVANRLLQQQ